MIPAVLPRCLFFATGTAIAFVSSGDLRAQVPQDAPPLKTAESSSHQKLDGAPAAQTQTIAPRRQPKFGPARNLDHGLWSGQATLSVKNKRLVRYQFFDLKVRFESHSNHHYYNVFFNGLDSQPAILALFNDKHEYLGDLLDWTFGSFIGTDEGSWTFIPRGGAVEATIRRHAGRVIIPGNMISEKLPCGTYYLQMIYNSHFVMPYFVRDGKLQREQVWKWRPLDYSYDLFRSNVLEIELIDEGDELPGE